jgi:hypothetical protein
MNSRLVPKIKKIRRTRDKGTNAVVDRFIFRLTDGKAGVLDLPPSEAHAIRTFEQRLRDAGAVLPKDKESRERLLRVAANFIPTEECVYDSQVGYVDAGAAYIKMDGLIGKASENIIGVGRIRDLKEESGKLSTSGAWQSWRDTVGEFSRHSSIMMFAICVGLAGFLLYFAKRSSFTICIVGETRLGKSIATLMAGSVRGIGRVEEMITWNITDTRLEQRLVEYNYGIFPIEDFEAMKEQGKEKYLRLRRLAYRSSQGWTTGSDESYTKAHGGIHGQYRCITLTSSEKAVRDLAWEVGLERQSGEALRLIDVPAALEGLKDIFDRLQPRPSQERRTKIFKGIADACEANHGAAGDKFVESLISHRSQISGFVERQVSCFVDDACDEFDGDIARDVARTFGLIYAAGMLGRKVGLLSWSQAELLDAITKCFKAARDLLPDQGVFLREGIDRLRGKLASLPFKSNVVSARNSAQVDGYREKDAERHRCVIRCEIFRDLFHSRTQCDLVLQWLVTKKRITMAVSSGSDDAPKKQNIWPDRERRRSYEIVWPRK